MPNAQRTTAPQQSLVPHTCAQVLAGSILRMWRGDIPDVSVMLTALRETPEAVIYASREGLFTVLDDLTWNVHVAFQSFGTPGDESRHTFAGRRVYTDRTAPLHRREPGITLALVIPSVS